LGILKRIPKFFSYCSVLMIFSDMSKQIEKLDHELETIASVGSKFDDILENKKNEAWYAAGGSAGAKDAFEQLKDFFRKTKEKLLEEVKAGTTPPAVAQGIVSYLVQSVEVLEKFSREKFAMHYMKLGEMNAVESSVKFLKKIHDTTEEKKTEELRALVDIVKEEAKKQAEQEAPPGQSVDPEPSSVEGLVSPPEESKSKQRGRKSQGGSRKRPDEVGRIGETVKRLKESRKNNSKK
jgi:hypothetical protein